MYIATLPASMLELSFIKAYLAHSIYTKGSFFIWVSERHIMFGLKGRDSQKSYILSKFLFRDLILRRKSFWESEVFSLIQGSFIFLISR